MTQDGLAKRLELLLKPAYLPFTDADVTYLANRVATEALAYVRDEILGRERVAKELHAAFESWTDSRQYLPWDQLDDNRRNLFLTLSAAILALLESRP